jgi:hypothetical protein
MLLLLISVKGTCLSFLIVVVVLYTLINSLTHDLVGSRQVLGIVLGFRVEGLVHIGVQVLVAVVVIIGY